MAVNDAEQLTTRSGYCLKVRRASLDDEAQLADFFEAVSSEDLRFRFLSAVNHVGQDRLRSLLDVDHKRTESFLAAGPDGRIVASALLACDPVEDVAEVAISIRADHKGQGIGWTLLDFVAKEAKLRGVKRLLSVESRENHSAIELEREMGFKAIPIEGDPSSVILEVRF